MDQKEYDTMNPTTGRGARGRFERTPAGAERDAKAVSLRVAGKAYSVIAAELGYRDHSSARKAVARALLATIDPPAAELRQLELERLADLQRRAYEVLEAEHVVIQQGRVVKLDGKPLRDDMPALAAIDRLLKIAERRAKLLGLDMPQQMQIQAEITPVDPADIELRRMIDEVRARNEQTKRELVESEEDASSGHDPGRYWHGWKARDDG